MPPPILNDSEDEDDDVVYDDSRDGLSRSSGESVPGISALDGTRDTLNQSTGSTERLKRQIYDAQWSLCGDSSAQQQQQIDNNGNPARGNPVSPTVKRDKRRNSTVHQAETTMSSVRRAKTINTYSTIKPSAASIEREQFLATFGEDAIAPGTSPSIRFSDHSGARGSSGLPTGSIQADFVNHEPAMFKESGSTIPDNESSHERMVEQALRSKNLKATSSPGIKLVESDEMQKSSSFPWSASEQTDVARSHNARDEQAAVPRSGENGDAVHLQNSDQRLDNMQQPNNLMPIDENEIIPGPATAVMIAPSAQNVPQRSSPTVHINPVEIQTSIPVESNAHSAEQTQKTSKGRKRKVQEESSEPLNSDDIAIGLPRERYKPRPSRRRATSVVEESIDYSVVPEKAAKSKRSKTVGSRRDSSGTQSQLSGKDRSPEVGRRAKLADDASTTQQPTDLPESTKKEADSKAPAKAAKSSPVVDVPATDETSPSQTTKIAPQDEVKRASQNITTNSQDDDLAFVKPAPRMKPASKSKRSSTTIFEDHVDFTGKTRSPSLSQQQAIRQSNLLGVKDEPSPVDRKRSRKVVIPDDDDDDEEEEEEEMISAKAKRTRKPVIVDDDEDELAFDPNAQDERLDEPPDAAPKKRGRGRPPKTPAKPSSEAPAKSAKQKKDENADEDAQTTLEEPPKKRRGRPPKSAAVIPNTDDVNDDQPEPHDDKVPAAESTESLAKESSPHAKQSSAKVIPTPSPEKQQPSTEGGKKASTSDKENKATSKASPPTHSPIKKSSSPAPYRVGLSKKHRIPSLLRVMRPPPQKRG